MEKNMNACEKNRGKFAPGREIKEEAVMEHCFHVISQDIADVKVNVLRLSMIHSGSK